MSAGHLKPARTHPSKDVRLLPGMPCIPTGRRVAEKLRERQLQRRVLQNVVFALDMFTEQKQQVATFVERLDMVKQQVNRHTDTIRHCVDNNFRPVIEQCTHLHKMIENIERIQGIPDVEGMDGMEDSISGALGLDLSRMVEAVATSAKEVMVISEEMQKTTDQVCDTAADCLHVAQNMKHTAENFELHAVDFFGVACRDDLGSPPELAAAVCRAEELVSEDGACGKLRAAASAMALAVDVQRRLVVQLEAATSAGHHRAVLLNPLPRFAPQLEACSSDGENKAAEVLAVETGDEEVVADARDQPTAPPASLALPPASEVGSTDDNEEEEEEIVRAVAKMIVTGATTKVRLPPCPLSHLREASCTRGKRGTNSPTLSYSRLPSVPPHAGCALRILRLRFIDCRQHWRRPTRPTRSLLRQCHLQPCRCRPRPMT